MRIRSCFFSSRVGLLVGLSVFFSAGWAEDFDGAKSRKIMPNDLITIQVVDEAELSMETRVAPDGSITYPFLKTVEVKGKTSAEVEKIIREGLLDGYLVKPEVIVNIKEFTKQTITVLGAVGRPGPVILPTDRKIDLIEAVGMAGDLTRLANKDKIDLRRKGEVHRYTYKQLKESTDPDKRIVVEADDVISVEERIF